MSGRRAKRLRHAADVLTVGRQNRWGIVRTVKTIATKIGGEVITVNRDTRVNDPASPRGVYQRLKRASKATVA